MFFYNSKPSFLGNVRRFTVGWSESTDISAAEMFARTDPDRTKLIIRELPVFKKRGRDLMLVRPDILPQVKAVLGAGAVSDDYFSLLMVFQTESRVRESQNGELTEEQEKWYAREKRGKLSNLLRNLSWEDEPENSSQVISNDMFRQIDLGRRSDLKLSSQDTGGGKYQSRKYERAKLSKTNPIAVAQIDNRDHVEKLVLQAIVKGKTQGNPKGEAQALLAQIQAEFPDEYGFAGMVFMREGVEIF